MEQMRKTKVQRILEYIRDNEPARAHKICEAVLKRRDMVNTVGPYFYYPGWSGFRVHLTQWGYGGDKKKACIRLTKAGYVLTQYGRDKLK